MGSSVMTTIESFEKLLDDLGNTQVRVRLAAQNQLVAYSALAVEPLIGLVQNGSLRQMAAAIPALAQIGDPRAIAPLTDILHGSQHSLLRMNAAQALAEFNDPAVITALLEALDDENELVLTWVVNSLAVLRDKRALEPLIIVLNQTPSPEIRYSVIRALGDLGDARAVEPIQRFLDHDNHHVQRYAVSALEKLTHNDS
jgi:HEAT repeat protein